MSVKAYLKFQQGWYPINSKTCVNYGNKEIPFCEQESIIKREIYIKNIIKGFLFTLFIRLQRDFSQTH